ncbi:MAG: TonB-dependent receptor [Nevskia sp.]|nr:TonB-dependent receptor [Nevskia sp.]
MGPRLRGRRRVERCGYLLAACAAGFNVAAPADDSAGQQQLKEVVVTAQKVRQTLEQVPASVTSVGGDYIRSTGAHDFQDLSSYTANTNLQVSSSSTQLLVRGFGTLNDVPGLDPSVGVVVDGVVYTYPEYLTAFFGDLDRYEVLRGPQGTLFGKNVTAGLLNITTNAPDQQRLFRWDLDMRSNGDRAFRPVINLPLGRDMALRLTGNFEHGDRGLLYNTDLGRHEQNQQQDSGRVRFRYDSHQGWTMDIGAFFAYHEENFDKQQLFIAGPNMQALARTFDPRFETHIDSTVSEDVPATENATSRGVSVTFEGDLGHPGGMKSLKITSISSVAENIIGARDIDADFSPVPFIQDSLGAPEPERQLTQELRVSGIGNNLFGLGHEANFVAGLYYDNYTLRTSDRFLVKDLGATLNYVIAAGCDSNHVGVGLCTPTRALGTALDDVLNLLQGIIGKPPLGEQSALSGLDQRTKDYAAFGQGEWYFLEHWSLIGGLRYAKENRTGQPHSLSKSLIIKAIAEQQDFDDTGANALHRTETDFSPKAGVKYQPNKHVEGYLTWAQGYKSGGFNGIPLNPSAIEYEPEKATSIEGGFKIKDRLFDGPIRGSLSLYHTSFNNLQVSTFQGTNVIIVNAAQARSMGFEADLMWLLPIRGLSLYSSFGFADARYTSYPNGPAPGDFDCGNVDDSGVPAQCTCPSDKGKLPGKARSGCGKDLTGKPLPFAPQWTAAMTPAYTFLHLPYGVSASLATDVLFQGKRYLNSEDDPRQLQQATLIVNPRLVFADETNGDWGLNLGIQNLTRETYSDQIIDQPLGPGNFAAIRGDHGRLYTGSFFINFH